MSAGPGEPQQPVSDVQRYVRGHDGTRLFLRTAGPEGSWISQYDESHDSPPSSSWGAKPAVTKQLTAVLCDGVLCDGFIWRHLWNDLARIMPVAHWNYRGHGRSAAPDDLARLGVDAHAADLTCVREAIGNPPVILFGHSMGTQVCLENAAVSPANVKGLVLICGSFGRVTHTFRGLPLLELLMPKIIEFEEKHPFILRALWSNIPTELAFNIASKMRDVDPERVRYDDFLPYLKHMTRVDPGLFLRMLREAGSHSAESKLAEIDIPTLIVAGERDTFTPPTLSVYMSEVLPRAKLLMVSGGSHIAPLEQPDVIWESIRGFIEPLKGT